MQNNQLCFVSPRPVPGKRNRKLFQCADQGCTWVLDLPCNWPWSILISACPYRHNANAWSSGICKFMDYTHTHELRGQLVYQHILPAAPDCPIPRGGPATRQEIDTIAYTRVVHNACKKTSRTHTRNPGPRQHGWRPPPPGATCSQKCHPHCRPRTRRAAGPPAAPPPASRQGVNCNMSRPVAVI